MFSWGEDCHQVFWSKHPPVDGSAEARVHQFNPGYLIRGLSAGHSVLSFIKTNGDAFIIRTHENKDGRRVRGKQKFVECREKLRAVSCTDDVVSLLTDSGSVLCVDTTRPPFTPRPMKELCNIPVCQVACGSQHSVALTHDGRVYTWGQDSRGQLGLGQGKPFANSPQQLRSLSSTPLVQVAAGGEQSFALSVSGGVFGWGRNDRGQLGLGDTTDRRTPAAVKGLNMKGTVHISCGKDHTATLTKGGAVFTFGSGQFGQLGHNSFSDQLRPRLVAELLGAKVTEIACGLNHTLVSTDAKKVYSFGCGEQGQLGHGDESHPSVPLPVQLPQGSSDGPDIRNIFAGGNCSFATCSSNEETHEEPNNDGVSNAPQSCLDDMIDKWTSECDAKTWKKIKQEIHRTFSTASCMNQSFLEKRKDKHFQTSSKYHGMNLSLARLAFKRLVRKDDVLSEVVAAVLKLLPSFEDPVGVEGLRIFLLLNDLLHVIQKLHRPQSTELAQAVAAAVLKLSAENLQVIGNWWTTLSASTISAYVRVWKKALSDLLSSSPVLPRSSFRNLLQVLQYMYNANSRTSESQRLPDSDFYLLMDPIFLGLDLRQWTLQTKQRMMDAEPLIIGRFPIVMDLTSKKLILDTYAEIIKQESCNKIGWDFYCMYGLEHLLAEDPLFRLELRRASISEDTFEQLDAVHHRDYKKRLEVFFDENFEQDDVNVNIKDFFNDVFHELVSDELGMFIFNDSKTLAWFPSNATHDHHRYFLFGVLCGLALHNQCIIYLPFSMALFKKLLGVKPSLEDLMEFSPDVGKSLLSILEEYGDKELESLGLDFLISWDGTDVDLDPTNPEKTVTSQNKKEFVDAYVNHVFNRSVESVFLEFKRGFYTVYDRDLLKVLRPKELQEVLQGKDFCDWKTLKQNTLYEPPYHVDHPNMQMFWEVFDELTEDQKKKLLWFVTGFERLPILGNKSMIIRLKNVGDVSQDQFYPETHTCYHYLDLPLYSTRESMKIKLTEALSNSRRSYK
ncbi:probable E3 ubiquitin-protein ligase HERC3 isoform X1 [Pleuronectes platessa]|uniref:probable E3 ubiquitin-protein ligase HERC3 isoform X1 n=1 Tax=Pleuronectes platessa TaxID=8262 RepID=UPI00232A1966|nr:probable E3 ubiquitin-protein ligase HERC3 isoform X1 [Pleuronectes platessa]